MSNPSDLPLADWRTSESLWDWGFLALVTILLLFMPLAFGAVEAWSELVVVITAACLSLCLALRHLLDRNFRVARSWVFLPLAFVLGLIVLQLIPLPPGLVGLLAPKNLELRHELLGEASNECGMRNAECGIDESNSQLATRNSPLTTHHSCGRIPLSLYPHATAHDLRMALVFVALFVTAASCFRTSTQIMRALKVVFVIGCLEAGIALLQIMTMSTKIHWLFAERGSVVTSGSFINYSHFCQFINLCLGTGLALLLIRLKEDRREDQFHTVGLGGVRWERYLRLLAGLVLCALAVLMSMSRNGAISLFAASAIVGSLLYYRGELSARGWLLGMAPWCVLIVLFLTSFDMVYERLATLDEGTSLEGRLEMTSGTLRAWWDFPLWGSGLGTYEFVFPLYDRAVSPVVAEHADNDWAQLLEEFGLIGTSAVLAFLLSILALVKKQLFQGRTILSVAVFGLCLGLIATAIHSLSDFGQHLPAVFSLTAIICGLILAIALYEKRKRRNHNGGYSSTNGATLRGRGGAVATLIGLGLVWCWALGGAWAAYRAEVWSNIVLAMESRLEQADWQVSDQDYVDLLAAAQQASAAEPDNVRLAYQLNLLRWQSMSRWPDSDTGELLLHPDALPIVNQIADELSHVRALCPTYGPPYALEGELRLFVLGQPTGERLIRLAAKLAPYDALSCLTAGQLAAQEGNREEAKSLLDRTVELDPRQFSRVASLYLQELKRPDFAAELAGENHQRLAELVGLLRSASSEHPSYHPLADRLTEVMQSKLREVVDSGQGTAAEIVQLATIEIAAENYELAIAYYKRALALDYGQVAWRMALARTLVLHGDNEQALREAKICLRLRPGWKAATDLIKQVSVLPITTENKQIPPPEGPN